MSNGFLDLDGIVVYEVSAQGPTLRNAQDAVDLISVAFEQGVAIIAIPVERLGDGFFELRSGIAGELLQKFAMYGTRVAIVGDISERIAGSQSLSALVSECNGGRDVWFVEDREELAGRLGSIRP